MPNIPYKDKPPCKLELELRRRTIALRKKRRLNREELAVLSGVPLGSMIALEQGRSISLRNFCLIHEYFMNEQRLCKAISGSKKLYRYVDKVPDYLGVDFGEDELNE